MLKIQKFGDKNQGITITGDPRNAEVENFTIKFPGGEVTVTRAVDSPNPDYWVHVICGNPAWINRPDDGADILTPAHFIDARLDQVDKHAADSNLGDFGRRELYHVALRVRRDD